MNKLTIIQNKSQPERARIIAKTLGITVAAKYLRARNWSIQAAHWILFNC